MKTTLMSVLAVVLTVGSLSHGSSPTSRPENSAPTVATTTDRIVDSVEPFKGFGCVQTAQFSRWGRQIFAVWFCPFSGRGDCYLFSYYYDYGSGHWQRFINRIVQARGDLSPEMPSGQEVIVFRTGDGKIALKESVAKFPQRKWWDDRNR